MGNMEDLEVLKAAMSVAVADGRISRSEMGVLKGLAARLGVGGASLEAMLDVARGDDFQADNILIRSKERARAALELLVAEARIDGDISFEERDVIVRIAASLNIVGDEFQSVYESGIARADRIRNSHTDSG
jgi:tellurite resistance protein